MVLAHHGIKGMKWGVRRWQYADGSLTPEGLIRYRDGNGGRGTSGEESGYKRFKKVASMMEMSVKHAVNAVRTQATGRQYVDTVLKKGTSFSRIQTSKEFEQFAFYATYKKDDIDKYMGLFGKNLMSRAKAEAKATSDPEVQEKAKNTKVYQLKIEATKRLRMPSDDNVSYILSGLLGDREFKKNLVESIQDSKEKMLRPTQQVLFRQAQNALKKDLSRLSSADKTAIYKAFNLSLVNHNPAEVAAQDRFYSELKKKGYNAILDYNDKDYSSYHAKRPVIVFDLDSVKLGSVAETNPRVVEKLYTKYNAQRIMNEIPANTIGFISKLGSKSLSEAISYVDEKTRRYMR